MTAKIAGVTPVVFFIAAFIIGAVILLSRGCPGSPLVKH
jgi:hypothetical protein